MRIERISDTQMKFVLMTDDLEERDINISELSYGSDKTQQLFREIMHLVQDEQEFVAENTPLMFEAMRVGIDSLVVVVTKINENAMGKEKKFSLIPAARQECRYKRGGIIDQPSDKSEDSHSVFSFADLDIMAAGASRLPANFVGQSQAYKMDDRFYLVLNNETPDDRTTAEMESVLYEFGQKHVSSTMSRQFLEERGEVIITADAVGKLCGYHMA